MRGQFDKNINIKLWNFKFNSARKNLSLIGKLKLQLKTFQRVADIRKTSNFFWSADLSAVAVVIC